MIVVKALQVCSVDVNFVGINDAQTPSMAGSWIILAELGAGVIEALNRRKRLLRASEWLIVGGLCLDLAHELH